MGLTLSALLLVGAGALSGCGSASGGHAGVGAPAAGSGSGSGGSGGSGKGAGAQIQLVKRTVNGMQVKLPAGWRSTRIGGSGDWSGLRFANPHHPNQQVVVVSSACVGCYTTPQGGVNPRLVIPHVDAADVVVTPDGKSARYQVGPGAKTVYPGIGVVTVSSNLSGYGYVEVYLPSAESSLARQIVDSFQLGR